MVFFVELGFSAFFALLGLPFSFACAAALCLVICNKNKHVINKCVYLLISYNYQDILYVHEQ